MRRFEDAVVLVTGGGSGIGRAAALAFGREGGKVVVSDLAPHIGEPLIAELARSGVQARFRACDVSKPEQVDALIDGVVRDLGRLDVAFNNASIEGVTEPVDALPHADWLKVINVNLNGVFFCMKKELHQMSRQDSGAVVNNASILGTVGFANASAYVAAAHGVLGLTRTAAIEFASRGIRVNAVCPGFIKKANPDRAGISREPGMTAQLANLHPAHRLGEAAEVAEAVLFLASPQASFITGHPLLVDGGYIAQ